MTGGSASGAQLPFAEDERAGTGEAPLIVDVDGFEGPLDLLLELARRQKVDLARISILALAEQYLAFIEEARQTRLELAADYLVMAAWLAYLKSRLLLPEPPRAEEPNAGDLASALARRLARLDTIRRLARMLMDRPQQGRDVHARGAPEPLTIRATPRFEASLHDLLLAYGRQRQEAALSRVTLMRRVVWSLAEAREALERLVGGLSVDWTVLDELLRDFLDTPQNRATVRASSFSAMLEMVREGHVDVRQDRAFGPLLLRRRGVNGDAAAGEIV
jgi:segregation and condensation protein A